MALIFFLSALLSHLPFVPKWLEDWDSVQFALALHKFDVVKHQPHPPGYPLYILLGRFTNLMFHNDTLTLTLMSSLFSALALIPFYLLVKKLFNKKTAFFASVIFMLIPVYWILAEVPVSNPVGLFFIITFTYLSYLELHTEKYFTFLGLISGVFLGVRSTDAPIVIGILTFLAVKKRNIRYILSLFGGFLLGVSLWLIPVIRLTGFSQFKAINDETRKYVIWHDMLFGKPFSLWQYFNDRILNLSKLLYIGFTPVITFLSILGVTLSVFKKLYLKINYQFLFIYGVSYLIPLAVLFNLELAQYTLPLVPIAALIPALMLSRLKPRISLIAFVTLIIYLFYASFPIVTYQARVIPPTIRPVLYILENLKPKETTLITTYTFRQFQYYAPEFNNYFGTNNLPNSIETKFVVIDYLGLKDQIHSLSKYKILEQKSFGESRNPFVRLNKTNVYILEKSI